MNDNFNAVHPKLSKLEDLCFARPWISVPAIVTAVYLATNLVSNYFSSGN